ncbi:ATP-grasp domain-containing protein [Streptomyces sp. NPDC046909]|uniref:ATP-grasp domain-containing protein n=1 Tax=Streptomyces sp. NPDC046909 TaxID=3155617 RepID=UPI0033F93D7D
MISNMRIVVTGTGGAPGFDLARHLMGLGCHVIASDANPLACGLVLDGVTPCLLPSSNDPHFGVRLLDVCRRLRPEALISTIEWELPALIAQREVLADLGVRTWLPDAGTVTVTGDKAAFHSVLTARGIPTPATWLPHQLDAVAVPGPFVVKPRRGHGSQNVHVCRTGAQAAVLCELVPDAIVQEHVLGQEFTADCLVDRTGSASVILRHRLLVKAGLSVVGRTFHDGEAAELVKRALDAVGVVGPCCVQGFLCESGGVTVTEVNARFAGGFPLAVAAGADLVEQTLKGLVELPVDHSRLAYKPDVYLTKCFETVATGVWPPPALSGLDESAGGAS